MVVGSRHGVREPRCTDQLVRGLGVDVHGRHRSGESAVNARADSRWGVQSVPDTDHILRSQRHPPVAPYAAEHGGVPIITRAHDQQINGRRATTITKAVSGRWLCADLPCLLCFDIASSHHEPWGEYVCSMGNCKLSPAATEYTPSGVSGMGA